MREERKRLIMDKFISGEKRKIVEQDDFVDKPRKSLALVASERGKELTVMNALEQEKKNSEQEEDDKDDDFDMFADNLSTSPAPQENTTPGMARGGAVGEDYDDSEGYYKATIGEVIYFTPGDKSTAFKVLGIIGK